MTGHRRSVVSLFATLLTAAVIVLPACSSGGGQSSAATTSSRITATSSARPSTTSRARPSPTSTTVTVAAGDLIAADPGFSFSRELLSGGSMYAVETTERGGTPLERVVRIDLGARRIVARYDVAAVTLAAAGDSLWVGLRENTGGLGIRRIVRLDRVSLARQGVVTLPGVPRTYSLASAATALWTLSGQDAIGIDPATARITASVRLVVPTSAPGRSLAVSNDGTRLYVGWSRRQQYGVTEFDTQTGRVLHENSRIGGGPVDAGPDLTVAGPRLWVTFKTGLSAAAEAVRASDLTRTGEGVGGSGGIEVAPSGTVLWSWLGNRVDCLTTHGKTVASYPLPDGGGGLIAITPTAAYLDLSNQVRIAAANPACLATS